MTNNNIIVFSNCHTNTLGLIRSLGEGGFKPILVEVNQTENSFVKASKYISEYHKVNTADKGIELIRQLFGKGAEKSVILTGSDSCAMIIDRHYDCLSSNFIVSSIDRKQGRLEKMLDKETIRQFAESVGLRSPKSWVIDCSEGVNLPSDLSYPCVIKAINSVVGRKDINIYRNEVELIKGINALVSQSNIIQVQEFIEKDFEILINGCVLSNGDIITSCALKKIRHYPVGFGGLAYGIVTPDIERFVSAPLLNKFLKELNYYGLFSVEFLIKGENAYFLEINLRNDGTSYISTYGGVNLPMIWTKDAFGLNNTYSSRIGQEFLASSAVVDFHYVTGKKLSFFRWLREISKSNVDLLWNKNDIKPLIKYLICRAKNRF